MFADSFIFKILLFKTSHYVYNREAKEITFPEHLMGLFLHNYFFVVAASNGGPLQRFAQGSPREQVHLRPQGYSKGDEGITY